MTTRFSSILFGSCCAAALLAGAPAHAQAAPDVVANEVETIVVTAERRETNLQQTPIAITALTGNTLAVNRVQTLTDLSSLAPGLIAQRSGSQNSVVYTMRGESSAGYLPGQASGIGTYIDGVYLGILTGTNTELLEIERVEVLRGPQGTLFGQNSTGGAVSVITRKPSGVFGGRQELTFGNFDQFRTKTRVDLPAFGPFSVSLSYMHNERKGDTKNLGAGTQWDFTQVSGGKWGVRTSPKTFGGSNNDAWGINILFEPSDNFEAIYRMDMSRNVFTDRAQGILGDPSLPVAANIPVPLFAGVYNSIPVANRTPISLTRTGAVNNYFSLPFRSKSQNHTFNASFKLNDNVTLKNITGYRKVTMEIHSMLDSAAGGNAVRAFVPFTYQSASSYNNDYMFSTEGQVQVSTDLLDFTGGVYYFKNHIQNGPRVNGGLCQSGFCLTTNSVQPYVISPGAAVPSVGRSKVFSVYGQANVHITDQLDFQGGLRYNWDRTKGEDNLSNTFFPLDYKDKRLSWLAGLNYQASDEVFGYIKAARGYIRGGQLAGIDFNPEIATSYEAGIKTDLFNRTLRTNLSIYTVKYEDLQAAGLLAGAGPGGGGLTVIFSVGDTRVKGIELESTWVTPLQGLTLGTSAAYTDSKYLNLNPRYALFNGLNISQMRFIQPKVTANLNATYTSPEMWWGGNIVYRVDGQFYWDRYLANSARSAVADAALHVKNRAIYNARLAFTEIDFGPTTAELALWTRNFTNSKGASNVTFIGYFSVNYEPERTFGVDLNFKF